MKTFFSTSQTVDVSRIPQDGWWIENTTEHVSKGTALGDDFTQNIYTPSKDGLIARYDRETDTWSDEIEDMSDKKFYSIHGQPFVIGVPDGEFPEGAVMDAPPEHNQNEQTVLYRDGQWKVYDIQIGKAFYDEHGVEYMISDYNFDLPENCTFEPKPLFDAGFNYKLVGGEWLKVEDHRGETVWHKETGSASVIDELGEIPEEFTTLEHVPYSTWDELENLWVISEEAEQQRIADLIADSILVIDGAAAAAAGKWTRFTEEYQVREAAALEFKAAEYTGECSLYISSFADAAGMEYQAATDLILKQANDLRDLQSKIAAQRMSKNKLKQPGLTFEDITALRDEIVLNIKTLGDSYD